LNLECAENLPSICARWQLPLALTYARPLAHDRNRTEPARLTNAGAPT